MQRFEKEMSSKNNTDLYFLIIISAGFPNEYPDWRLFLSLFYKTTDVW